mgnify:CR=1 FL=1
MYQNIARFFSKYIGLFCLLWHGLITISPFYILSPYYFEMEYQHPDVQLISTILIISHMFWSITCMLLIMYCLRKRWPA